jgi:hypothetical protein
LKEVTEFGVWNSSSQKEASILAENINDFIINTNHCMLDLLHTWNKKKLEGI